MHSAALPAMLSSERDTQPNLARSALEALSSSSDWKSESPALSWPTMRSRSSSPCA
jgi:hypothetical protein